MYNFSLHIITTMAHDAVIILPKQKRLESPGRQGVFRNQKKIKKCLKLNWNFQRGGEVLDKLLNSIGEVWVFYGTTHSCKDLKGKLVMIKKMLENHNRCTAYIVINHDKGYLMNNQYS